MWPKTKSHVSKRAIWGVLSTSCNSIMREVPDDKIKPD
jgi:hypothetical protein